MSTQTAMAPSFTIDSTDDYNIGSASSGGEQVAAWMIHIINDNSATFSLTVKAQSTAAPAATPYLPVGYRAGNLNATAADWSLVADTAITDSSIIVVPCSGLNIQLSVSAMDTSVSVYLTPMYGPSVI